MSDVDYAQAFKSFCAQVPKLFKDISPENRSTWWSDMKQVKQMLKPYRADAVLTNRNFADAFVSDTPHAHFDDDTTDVDTTVDGDRKKLAFMQNVNTNLVLAIRNGVKKGPLKDAIDSMDGIANANDWRGDDTDVFAADLIEVIDGLMKENRNITARAEAHAAIHDVKLTSFAGLEAYLSKKKTALATFLRGLPNDGPAFENDEVRLWCAHLPTRLQHGGTNINIRAMMITLTETDDLLTFDKFRDKLQEIRRAMGGSIDSAADKSKISRRSGIVYADAFIAGRDDPVRNGARRYTRGFRGRGRGGSGGRRGRGRGRGQRQQQRGRD
jgi:hypothetical protein